MRGSFLLDVLLAILALGVGIFAHAAERSVLLQFEPRFSTSVQKRILSLVESAEPGLVQVQTADRFPLGLATGSLVISFGRSSLSRTFMTDDEVSSLGADGFIVRSEKRDGVQYIAIRGNGSGLYFGSYETLTKLGFSFLYPGHPEIPKGLPRSIDIQEVQKPFFKVRGWKLSPDQTRKIDPLSEGAWSKLTQGWMLYLEWLLAHKQNYIEWILTPETEREAIHSLNQIASQWGIKIRYSHESPTMDIHREGSAVPLFLPVLADLGLKRIRQSLKSDDVFSVSNGWNWGHWLNDAIMARASWDPKPHIKNSDSVLLSILKDVLLPFEGARASLADTILSHVRVQREVLLKDKNRGLKLLTGVSSGKSKSYLGEIRPLLSEIEIRLHREYLKFLSVERKIPFAMRSLFEDLKEASLISALRSRQVFAVQDSLWQNSARFRKRRLSDAKKSLDLTESLIRSKRETGSDLAFWLGSSQTHTTLLYPWWKEEYKAAKSKKLNCEFRSHFHEASRTDSSGLWKRIHRGLKNFFQNQSEDCSRLLEGGFDLRSQIRTVRK